MHMKRAKRVRAERYRHFSAFIHNVICYNTTSFLLNFIPPLLVLILLHLSSPHQREDLQSVAYTTHEVQMHLRTALT